MATLLDKCVCNIYDDVIRYKAPPPNLKTANISGYTVVSYQKGLSTRLLLTVLTQAHSVMMKQLSPLPLSHCSYYSVIWPLMTVWRGPTLNSQRTFSMGRRWRSGWHSMGSLEKGKRGTSTSSSPSL